MEMTKIVVLDRDGVINHDSAQFIKSPEEWHAIPGSLEAIARLCREDYRVVIMTNQSGISRGYFSIDTLNRIHQKLLDELNHYGGEISAIFFCPHNAEANCSCRKPDPGMFQELSERSKCGLTDVPAVGDSMRDLEAAAAAGAKPILVRTGKGRKTEQQLQRNNIDWLTDIPIAVFDDLSAYVDYLLRTDRVEVN